MYGSTSHSMQSRTRRAAAFAPTNGGIAASDAFRAEFKASSVEDEVYRLTMAVQDVQERLTAARARGVGPNHPDRVRLAAEFQQACNALSRVKGLMKAKQRKEQAERDRSFDAAFVAVAREMLAGPVYERLVAAAQHRIHEAHD